MHSRSSASTASAKTQAPERVTGAACRISIRAEEHSIPQMLPFSGTNNKKVIFCLSFQVSTFEGKKKLAFPVWIRSCGS